MIVLGLYLTGWWHGILVIEKAGQRIWRVIEPLGKRFMPPRTPLQVFGLGLVWGWLPCGLVYSALALAAVSASPQRGTLLMLGFGLGTLPMLLAMGSVAGRLRKIVQHSLVREISGAIIILFGVYTCATAFNGQQHNHAAINHGITEHKVNSKCLAQYSATATLTRFETLFELFRSAD